ANAPIETRRFPTTPRRLITRKPDVSKYESDVVSDGSPNVTSPMRRYSAVTDTPGAVNDSRKMPTRVPSAQLPGEPSVKPSSSERVAMPTLATRSTEPRPPTVGATLNPSNTPTAASALNERANVSTSSLELKLRMGGNSVRTAVNRPSTLSRGTLPIRL